MDWISVVLLGLIVLTTLHEVHCIRMNPFTGFSETNYDQLSDFSINQGAYLPNMPVASIFPMMNDDNFNAMIGLPSLKSPMIPFMNPLSSTMSQMHHSRPPATRSKAKSVRNNNQRTPNGNPQQKQRNGPPKTRGVTLDIRGGGYKVEQKQNNRPYKSPNGESSGRNSQRHNNNRNTGGNSGRPSNIPPRNRKPNQRPRGPTMKNPHYNMKFETSLPSMPPNVEFVNPENVLPFHPRIYKPFLQQNKQFGAFLQNMNKMNPSKPKSQNNGNFGSSFQGTSHNSGKQSISKTRNRGNPPSSSVAQSSHFPSFAPNFQMPGSHLPSTDLTSQFGFQKQNTGKLFNSPFESDLLNQDPSFYASLSQTPDGRAVLSQLQQQAEASNNNQFPKPQSQISQFTNQPSSNVYQNSKPSPFANSNPSFQGPVGSPTETGNSPSFTNYFGGNHGKAQYDGSNTQSNIKPSSLEKNFQQMMLYYQQMQKQQQQQQPSMPSVNQYPTLSNPTAPAMYGEPSQSSPSRPNYPPSQQQYPNSPVQMNPYNEYQFMQGSSYQDSPSQVQEGQPQPYGKGLNTQYEDNSHLNSYQASQKQIESQMSEIQNADQADYTLPPFSPIDPLATAIESGQKDIQDYYGYQQESSEQKLPLYPNEQNPPSGGSSGMHEISPYSDEKNSPEYEISVQSSSSKPPSSEMTSGYMTPEQLFAPHATGLQNAANFGFPSAHGGQSHTSFSHDSTETEAAGSSHDEQHEGNERAALHLPEEVSIYVARQTENPYLYEYTEAYDPFSIEVNDKLKVGSDPSKQIDVKDNLNEAESDEKFNERIREFQKLLTKAPKSSYMVEPTESASSAKTFQTTTTRVPVLKKASDVESEEMKNHKTTHSYMFQYAPAEKTNTKATPVWNAWKPNVSRYHLPLPETKPQFTTTVSPTTTTTTTTQAPPSSSPTPGVMPSTQSYYHEPETPACARFNNLTYCLQDPEYPKDQIKEAIERNRHPLDHFLVDISASSNIVDDNLNKVFENSVPLQSTSVSYSFEGKAIAPTNNEASNSTGCISNVYYAKPLRAINTAGLWKIIVNVEFEETGANYTQTVRIEECSHISGFVATCGTETISACLQQYKLYRLLAWEPHRGFYIDAFLLPISCFCGSQQSR